MNDGDVGAQLKAILGTLTHVQQGGPRTLRIPAVLGLTGAGATYGLMQRDGLALAAQHVGAWTDGQLQIEWQYFDHESCVPGPDAVDTSALGVGGGVMITSFVFCFGAQVAAIQEGKTLAFDPVGGTGIALKGLPYCYGLRSSWPDDTQDGLWQVITTRHPSATRWVVVSPEYAEGWDVPLRHRLQGIADGLGIDLSFIRAPYGARDYSDVVAAMRSAAADVYVLLQYGEDIIRTTRDLEATGMLGNAIFVSLEYDREQVEAVGHLWDGWYVGNEDFNAEHPTNPWSALFVSEFTATFGSAPQNYTALMYSATFVIARLIDRILGFGGTLDCGDDFVRALEMDPAFPHLYGGTSTNVGQLVVDVDTHSPRSLPLVALQSTASHDPTTARRIATYDIGGRSLRFLAPN